MRKALFFDIDGTLVNFRGQMPESAKRALKRVQEMGHLIVICSGRSVCQIYPWLLDMKFDGIIGAAGAYVECGGRVIYEHHMEEETLGAVIELLEQAGACYSAQTRYGVVSTEDSRRRMLDRFRIMGLDIDMADQVWSNYTVDEHLEKRRDIEKFNFFGSGMTVAELGRLLSEYCDVNAMSFERPAEGDGEISARGINKALGIQKYIEYAGIARGDTIAFGDGPNDLDMMEYAGVGVAMGNAIEDVKAKADYVTTSIDEDGIEHALQELGVL